MDAIGTNLHRIYMHITYEYFVEWRGGTTEYGTYREDSLITQSCLFC